MLQQPEEGHFCHDDGADVYPEDIQVLALQPSDSSERCSGRRTATPKWLTRRQSQRRHPSRLLLAQESRRLPSWLIFDVRQKMATARQLLGELGEKLVTRHSRCPKCKRAGTLKRLPTNFRCADVICDFCGYLAQVKASTVEDPTRIPDQVLAAAWAPQKARMRSGIYFPLFLVLYAGPRNFRILYLPADLQEPSMFIKRAPLSATARRAGWQGFNYSFRRRKHLFAEIFSRKPNKTPEPTPGSVTPRADARVAPAPVVAHL